MILVICDCDSPAANVPTIPDLCRTDSGDMWKLILRRGGQPGAADVATFQTVAYWTGLEAAIDDTKVSVTPKIDQGTIPEASPVTIPSHNNSEEVIGFSAQRLTAEIRYLDSAVYDELVKFPCEVSMAFYLINSRSQILAKKNGASPKAIPIDGIVTISPPQRESGGELKSMISFNLPTDWYSDTGLFALTDGDAKVDI